MKKLDNFNDVESFWFKVATALLIIVIVIVMTFVD